MLTRSDLHKYQEQGVDFIYSKKKCALFLFLGAGKTVTTLTAVSDMLDSFVISKILVIAPLRVCTSVWKQEGSAWDHLKHLRISVCTGSAKERTAGFKADVDIYVINRENVQKLVEECKKNKKWPYDAVIIDESSSFKNPSAKRFRKLKSVLKYIDVMVLLTGTPSPNSLLDLFSQMFLIDQGQSLGKTMTGYKERFFTPDYMGYNWTIKEGAEKTIHDLIKPKVLSMTGDDYLQLPERIDIVEKVHLPDKVMKQYKEFERELLLELVSGEEVEGVSAAVLANKLLQFSNGALYTDDAGNWEEIHTVKLDALADVIEDNPDENILIAYNYKSDLTRILKRFPMAIQLDKKPFTIDQWNAGKIKLMVAHPGSCGHGINLQYGGAMIVWFGLNWSLEYNLQMNARLDRQGQERPVRVIRIVSAGTIDERVLKVLENKDSMQNDLINALKNNV